MLGSSRGPQSAEEIVDALERSNVNILFIIGGDGTMKAAQAISTEIQARNLKLSIIGIPKTIDNDINFIPSPLVLKPPFTRPQNPLNAPTPKRAAFPTALGW